MPIENIDSARIARIDERTMKTDQKLDMHISDDNTRFERMFKFVKDGFDKIDGHFDHLEGRLDTLWDESNQRKGAFAFGRLGITALWAFIGVLLTLVLAGGHS